MVREGLKLGTGNGPKRLLAQGHVSKKPICY